MILGLFFSVISKLKTVVDYLPESIEGKRSLIEPVIGKKLGDNLPISEELISVPAIIMMASATCSTCHDSLEEFLQRNDQESIPFACYLLSNDEEYLSFVSKYKEEFPIYQINKEVLLNFGIEMTPSFLLTNNKGIVEAVNYFTDPIIDLYKKNNKEI